MGIRRFVARATGLIQTAIGSASLIFAFFLFYNVFNLQAFLGFQGENIELYVLAFITFGLISVISGLVLFCE
ncbi:MAG: hypothetical protein QXY88_03420 [Candidatus Bathyarchaeia archaeon]